MMPDRGGLKRSAIDRACKADDGSNERAGSRIKEES